MSYDSTLDRWRRERQERQRESEHQYEVSRLQQEVRDQEYHVEKAYRQAESYRQGTQAAAQAECKGYREDIDALEEEIAELEERLEVSQLWAARWKTLAKKQRAGRAAAEKGERCLHGHGYI